MLITAKPHPTLSDQREANINSNYPHYEQIAVSYVKLSERLCDFSAPEANLFLETSIAVAFCFHLDTKLVFFLPTPPVEQSQTSLKLLICDYIPLKEWITSRRIYNTPNLYAPSQKYSLSRSHLIKFICQHSGLKGLHIV